MDFSNVTQRDIFTFFCQISITWCRFNLGVIFCRDIICGQSLVGSHACGPPVFQSLLSCQISSQYLPPLRSSGSDTIRTAEILVRTISLKYGASFWSSFSINFFWKAQIYMKYAFPRHFRDSRWNRKKPGWILLIFLDPSPYHF
jgi:hypothetical protein